MADDAKSTNYRVADMSLADWGRKEINIAEKDMSTTHHIAQSARVGQLNNDPITDKHSNKEES